jgi:catechol 2,3-dioxygenase-like lactoylglutathione lyase family enzyme
MRFHSVLFFVSDLSKTAEFYQQVGFAVEKSEDAVRVKLNGVTLAFMDEKKVTIDQEAQARPRGLGLYFYFEVDKVDEFYKTLLDKKIKPSSTPKSWPWGKREFALRDPDRYKLIFYSPVR